MSGAQPRRRRGAPLLLFDGVAGDSTGPRHHPREVQRLIFVAIRGLFTSRIRIELIIEQWDELLRLAASLKRGWIVPSVLLGPDER